MPRFTANLSLLYPEHDFLDRFDAAAQDGFEAVEFLFPYAWPAPVLAQRLQGAGLQQVLLNASPGDWEAGDRGLAGLPGREDDFRRSLDQALSYARALACPRIHLMAGVAQPGRTPQAQWDTYQHNLAWAAEQTAGGGVDLLIEPLNTRDMPGYLLTRQDQAHALVQLIGAPHLKVQMDLYHCQIMEGDVATKLRHYLPSGRVGHLQIAGVPQRHEPDLGELNYRYLLQLIDELSANGGWQGWVGCEYRPSRGTAPGGTRAGLGWRSTLQR